MPKAERWNEQVRRGAMLRRRRVAHDGSGRADVELSLKRVIAE